MRGSLALRLAILVSASLLAVGHLQVHAQFENDIPDSVLVTGPMRSYPLLLDDPSPPTNERLTQLSDRELRALLPGATIHPVFRLFFASLSMNCDGSYEYRNVPRLSPPNPPPAELFPVYSIRDNQVCLTGLDGLACYKFFRSRTGDLFSDVYNRGRAGLRLVEVTPPSPDQSCRRR
jgi:hypothetical protein